MVRYIVRREARGARARGAGGGLLLARGRRRVRVSGGAIRRIGSQACAFMLKTYRIGSECSGKEQNAGDSALHQHLKSAEIFLLPAGVGECAHVRGHAANQLM